MARKPYEQRSARFQAFAEVRNRHHARWNFQNDGKWVDGHYIVPTKGSGIFGHCTHILGSGVRIAALYWQRYEYTLDQEWLKDRAYPMLKGMAEFYRNFPNFQKGADGKYHIHHVNSGEQGWNTSDSVYEVNCLHLIFPLAIRASEILGVDADLRAKWQEIKDNLVPAPGKQYEGGYITGFIYAGEGAIEPQGEDIELKRRFLSFNQLGSFIDGKGIGGAQIFRNRLRLREGPGAIDAENIGALSGWIHSALLQNTAVRPGGAPVIQLFSLWPRDWDTEFKLLAPGAFIVSSAREGGRISFVEIQSQAGSECRLANPWKGVQVTLRRNGTKAEDLFGELLTFATKKGETIVIAPKGSTPSSVKIFP